MSSLGLNLGPAESWNGNAAWANARRSFRRWGSIEKPYDPATAPPLDANKYPASVPAGAFGELSGYPKGAYKLSFEGAGATLGFVGASGVSSFQGGMGAALTIAIDPAAGPTTITLRDAPIRNLQLLSPDAAPGDTFRTAFLADLAPAKVIRFMDPMAVNNSSVKTWADRAKPDDWCATIEDYDNPHLGGWSYEDAITLCNTIGAEPWFCIPDQADNDYIRQLARLIKSTLKPGLTARIEWSNEVWNPVFQQYQRVKQACGGKDLGTPEFFNHWAACIALTKHCFDAEGCPLKLVVASQAGNLWVSEQLLLALKTLGVTGDVLAIAPYIAGRWTFPTQDTAKSLDEIFTGADADLKGFATNAVTAHAVLAKKYGMELACYEFRPLALEGGANFDLKLQAQDHPRAGQLLRDFWKLWTDNRGGTCCLYYYRGPWAAGEIWGCRDSAPIWGAFTELAGPPLWTPSQPLPAPPSSVSSPPGPSSGGTNSVLVEFGKLRAERDAAVARAVAAEKDRDKFKAGVIATVEGLKGLLG